MEKELMVPGSDGLKRKRKEARKRKSNQSLTWGGDQFLIEVDDPILSARAWSYFMTRINNEGSPLLLSGTKWVIM